ncbi:uncharacterized protein LOC130804516 isoform X1 [Amaranthus tricolor]|uniref:uncharacterized protein LOC130804516 isoform X1 n=1 Tax=Amaranthus tricolor TaxID=29722 RepID=UPI002583DFCE|nr:uncharacterized protein LOC130804516 isoform X1 [Amaranthus tricolor]XP_057524959.1 uncharacterized protein LOC130804516 isoform X1 [Amaranthus tricolor]
MRAESGKVLIDPCLQQCEAAHNGLAASPRCHSELPIQVEQGHRTPGNLMLIDGHGKYRVRSHAGSGLICQQGRADDSHVVGCRLRIHGLGPMTQMHQLSNVHAAASECTSMSKLRHRLPEQIGDTDLPLRLRRLSQQRTFNSNAQYVLHVVQHNRHFAPWHVEGVRIRLPPLHERRYQSTVVVLVHNVR